MMRRLLELSGFNVAEATNGAEAVRTAEFERPEIILMDLSLPIIDGLAATRRIRQLPELEDVPIIPSPPTTPLIFMPRLSLQGAMHT